LTAAVVTPAENRAAGILWMLATMLGFIALDAIMKYELAFASLVEVTWARFFFATLFAIIACGRELPRLVQSDSPGVQLARSCFLAITTVLFVAGLRHVPLATATTIMFLSPIFVTILSIPLLGEHVGVRRWAGILAGLAGAVVVIAPWREGTFALGSGVLFLVGASLTNALYQLTTRKLRNDDPMTSLVFTASVGAAVATVMLPWHFTNPPAFAWVLFAASGAVGLLSHMCLIKALRAAPASVVAPLSYSSLVWATLFGLIIWQDWPEANTWIGAAMIVASGLYIFYRERVLKGSAA
jgi:drug/metabolite transporter (DMT)-like permease